MVFEGIWFNAAYWKGKTEAEFIKHEGHHGLGLEKMKEAFAAIQGPVKQTKKDQPLDSGTPGKPGV